MNRTERKRKRERNRKKMEEQLHQPAAACDGTNWPTRLTCARGKLNSQLKNPYGRPKWKKQKRNWIQDNLKSQNLLNISYQSMN